jgi:hypothetical protein
MTIYFVDEDYPALAAWIEELRLRQHFVVTIGSADEAFGLLVGRTDIDLAIIDVMLAVENVDEGRFSRERTDEYLQTGLCLLEDLAMQLPDIFPRRAVLLTNTINDETYRAAVQMSRKCKIPLWGKYEIESPFEFADRVGALVKTIIPLEPRNGSE